MNTTEYLLSWLIEECAEVIQRATKAQRFGLQEVQPSQDLTNEERLRYEVGDLMGTLTALHQEGVSLIPAQENVVEAKLIKMNKYMDYSRSLGTL